MNVYNLPTNADLHVLLYGDDQFVVPFADQLKTAGIEFSILPPPSLITMMTKSIFSDDVDSGPDFSIESLQTHMAEYLAEYGSYSDRIVFADKDWPSHISHIALLGPDTSNEVSDLIASVSDRYQNPVVLITPITETATAAQDHLMYSAVVAIGWIPGMGGDQLMEIAPALTATEEDVLRAQSLFTRMSIGTERVQDRIGLVRLRTLAMLINEAAFAVMEGVATPADIDAAMKLGVNYPKGLLEWADEIGLDIILEVLTALHNEYGQERYRPCVLLKQYVRAGWMGKLLQRGFYTYDA
jgi:3-hydroxybutyryl-CoA dehydrogenase